MNFCTIFQINIDFRCALLKCISLSPQSFLLFALMYGSNFFKIFELDRDNDKLPEVGKSPQYESSHLQDLLLVQSDSFE